MCFAEHRSTCWYLWCVHRPLLSPSWTAKLLSRTRYNPVHSLPWFSSSSPSVHLKTVIICCYISIKHRSKLEFLFIDSWIILRVFFCIFISCVASNGRKFWVMDVKEWWSKWSWHILRYYPDIWMEELRISWVMIVCLWPSFEAVTCRIRTRSNDTQTRRHDILSVCSVQQFQICLLFMNCHNVFPGMKRVVVILFLKDQL